MSKPNEKIGLYGGSFDPIHNGHLILARDAMERLELDKVIFLPARISPHKLDRPPAPPEARCQMLCRRNRRRAALRNGSPAKSSARDPRSQSIPSSSFRERHPRRETLLLSSATTILPELDTWKDIAISSASRRSSSCSRALGCHSSPNFQPSRRHIEISSTEIRNRVARGLSVRYMVPLPACEVIAKLGLYRDD